MSDNGLWDLVKLLDEVRTIDCKWVFKTSKDSKDRIDKSKARLVVEGFTQKESIDLHETFFPVSIKDSFIIIMTLMTHSNLELHQMNVKTIYLNESIYEEIYMK